MTIILLILGFFLIGINIIALKKDSSSFNKVMINEKEHINSIKEIEDAIFNLQMEIEEVKLIINSDKNKDAVPEEKTIETVHSEAQSTLHDKIEKKNNVKIDEIKELLDKGMTLEEIAQKLQIGKGELLLIKELYLK